jgi:hypothetical protein
VEGLISPQDTVDEFANFFESACLTNSAEKDIEINEKFKIEFKKYESNYFVNYESQYQVDSVMVESNINQLKNGKAAGADDLTSEHLKYAHPVLCVLLKKLFNLMLSTYYVPADFGIGVIIPIPKSSNACNSHRIQDFRGITISPVLSKVFEQCLFQMFGDYLTSSPHQFGFKKERVVGMRFLR